MLLKTIHARYFLFLIASLILLPSLAAQPGGISTQTQYLAVLLADGGGAPTPEEVVDSFAAAANGGGIKGGSSSPPILSGLSVENPISVYYLLPMRAQGAFKQSLEANPNSARAKLERYLLIEYPASADLNVARSSWQADPHIMDVDELPEPDPVVGYSPSPSSLPSGAIFDQWGREALRIDQAWAWNGGHSVVGILDTGLSTLHPELEAFDEFGNYTGGNYLDAGSFDWGEAFIDTDGDLDLSNVDANVDEAEPVVPPTTPPASCDPDGDGAIVPSILGHGTHVSGILAANSTDGTDVHGVCRHCSIWMQKIVTTRCSSGVPVFTNPSPLAGFAAALTFSVDFGVPVINLSAGFHQAAVNCDNPPNSQISFACLALDHAEARQTLVVASSGNDGDDSVDFPARDPRVVAVGGIERDLSFWNDCPGPECGSNYGPNQELVAPAKEIRSTFYEGFTYVPNIGCDDLEDGLEDGYGPCTGTSMSAPHVAGLFGILRSTNPLVPNGDPTNGAVIGLRDVVVNTTFQAQQGEGFDQQFGWGIPDAELAVETVLGSAKGETVRNRATPLFTLRRTSNGDFVSLTSPQGALGYIGQGFEESFGFPIPGFPEFPTDQENVPSPGAFSYILTTPNKITASDPNPILLYRMVRSRADGQNDFFHVASESELENFKASDGARLHGLEGYLYSSCSGQPGCQLPLDAVPMYRVHNPASDDHALVSGDQLNQSPFNSYGSPVLLGYALRNSDNDGDGLVNGFERMIGTNPNSSDSDCDGLGDGLEFPLAGISTSDPLDGCNLQADLDIESVFEFNQFNYSLVNHGPDFARQVVVAIDWSSPVPTDTFQPTASECVAASPLERSASPGGSFLCTFDRLENGEAIDLYSWTTVSTPFLQVTATIESSASVDPNP